MKIRMEVEVTKEQLRIIQTNSLERVLNSVMEAKTKPELDGAKYDLEYLKGIASQLWYVASSSVWSE